jgi:hypothetical protein
MAAIISIVYYNIFHNGPCGASQTKHRVSNYKECHLQVWQLTSDGVETFFSRPSQDRDIEKPVSSRDSCLEDSIQQWSRDFFFETKPRPRHWKTCLETVSNWDSCLEDSITAVNSVRKSNKYLKHVTVADLLTQLYRPTINGLASISLTKNNLDQNSRL